MNYNVSFSPRAWKEIRKLPKSVSKRCIKKIEEISKDPFSRGTVKIKSYKNVFRIRIGRYRIVYRVYPEKKLIVIVRIAKRESVYQGL